MLRKRKTPTLAPQAKKRRRTTYTVEEIKFDPLAREDYLTGFHKRKLQRIKHAKEEAAKKEREDKIEARRIVC
jgi:ribosomal RNA-processing protein 17